MDPEQAVAAMNLDEGADVVDIPVTPSADPPPAVEPTDDPDPEGVIFATNGEKMVTLKALREERGKRKETEKALHAKDAELEPIKQKAQRYDEASQYLEQARPIIEKIKARPDILKLADQPPSPPEVVAGPLSPAEAIEYAQDFDLYTADGKPDVERAQRIAKRHYDMSARQAQQAVTPILQTEAQRQSTQLYQQYLAQPEVNGIKVDPKFLAETWNSVPPEVSADPRVAQVLFMNTIGRQLLSGTRPMPAPSPVVTTESVGGGRPAMAALPQESQRFMQAAGIKPAEFAEVRERYKPGQQNSLE